MTNNILRLPLDKSVEFSGRFIYYKELQDKGQISEDQYLEKMVILKYDIDKEVDKLIKMDYDKAK